ncbi:unnamed protein product [Soboliphyme baturini]|uniref:Low-density lipoprotein receptor domain class A n=1 Tax=Soboliphyme baturini TaxID=241478 RepID=A0A183IDE3_9BILA|nr:unnamed protein product [Soboliphyme baturini]
MSLRYPNRSNDAQCIKDLQFECQPGICIPVENVCDGVFDCADGIDELQNCTCALDRFPCNNGKCVQVAKWCDGNNDCGDNSDESKYCYNTCPPGFREKVCVLRETGESGCLHHSRVCDGFIDCLRNEDELGCDCESLGMFRCGGNGSYCVPWSKYCNGQVDCADSSDEPPKCYPSTI